MKILPRCVLLILPSLALATIALFIHLIGNDAMPVMKKHFEILPDGRLAARFYTVDPYVPPTYLTCTNFDLSGSFSVSLNAAGEAYFGDYAADVNTALSAAVSDAVSNLLATAGTRCEDDCYAVLSNEQSSSSGDADATAMIVLNQGGDSTEICWPDPAVPPDTGIHITASAPGVAGVDLRPFISAMEASYPIDTPSEVAAGLAAVIADLLAEPSLIATIDPDTGDVYYDISGNKGISIKQSGDVTIRNLDASGTDPEPWFQCTATAFYDSISFVGDTLVITGRNAETVYRGAPSGAWGSDPADSNFFPDDFSLENGDGSTPRTIDQTILLTNTGGETDVHTPDGDTASLTASGAMTIALTPADPELTDPGTPHTYCMWDVWYRSRRPIDWACGRQQATVLRFWFQGPTKFRHPPGQWPKLCEFPVWVPPELLES